MQCRQNYPQLSTSEIETLPEPNSYNQNVEKYYSVYKSYLENLWNYEVFSSCNPEVKLDVKNIGNMPETNLRISLMFPDLVRCLLKEEVTEPLRPSAPAFNPTGFYGTLPDRRRFNYFCFGPGCNYPHVDEERQTVTYFVGRVGHHSSCPLSAFFLQLDPEREPQRLDCQVTIVADEIIDPIVENTNL